MTRLSLLLPCLLAVNGFNAQVAIAQIKVANNVRYGNVQSVRYRVGVSVDAKRGPLRGILATFAVPLTCPEQEVVLLDEDITEHVQSYEYRTLRGGGARQMVVKAPQLPDRAELRAVLTFDVRTRTILPPADTSALVIPKKPPRELKMYLGKSPMIETNHSKIKKLAREIFANLENPPESSEENDEDNNDDEVDNAQDDSETESEEKNVSDEEQPLAESGEITDWQRVEAIYDYVQENITYKAQDDKSALATLKDGHGDCQNISALFIAICRTQKIPARIVWVHEHNYPEFCLEDAEGKLHWFPCESSGSRAFGEMPIARVIMQKGDNFKVPEQKKALRYASGDLIATPARSGVGKPTYKQIREKL